ncbi:hypothetical protein A6U97_02470 [Agrobacterium tumefaciens]|uniref:hypothetical protein n=1 Tax=Agrobacterium tumefaciens TaxID=358 RepID=UPI00080F7498|nr:hypothetical protein A6U97_02470 [Agrobacterium tumefaciens]
MQGVANVSGYVSYRYGTQKKPTLPKVKAFPEKPIGAQHAERITASIMDVLKDWRYSPFENEASTRYALRNWFISRRHGWHLSDAEASTVIANAFDAMGLERPSWIEGQWIYTVTRDQCVWCGTSIDEEDQTKGKRFCSGLCAQSCLEKRVRETATKDDWVYQRAHVELANSAAPERSCKHCGTMFRNRNAAARFCSTGCHDAIRRAADIPCLWCGTMFHPKDHNKKYCCKECANKGFIKTREASLVAERSCKCCLAIFRPRMVAAIYCSPRCTRIMANRAYRGRQRQAAKVIPFVSTLHMLTAEVFDGWFRKAA